MATHACAKALQIGLCSRHVVRANSIFVQCGGDSHSYCTGNQRARDPHFHLSHPACHLCFGPCAPVVPAQQLSRAMLLDPSGAKQLAGPTKLRSSVRFAMHILDLNEKQTGLTQGWQAHTWQWRSPGKKINKRRSIGLTCKCQLIIVKLSYQPPPPKGFCVGADPLGYPRPCEKQAEEGWPKQSRGEAFFIPFPKRGLSLPHYPLRSKKAIQVTR